MKTLKRKAIILLLLMGCNQFINSQSSSKESKPNVLMIRHIGSSTLNKYSVKPPKMAFSVPVTTVSLNHPTILRTGTFTMQEAHGRETLPVTHGHRKSSGQRTISPSLEYL
jgi:hypothetical protein